MEIKEILKSCVWALAFQMLIFIGPVYYINMNTDGNKQPQVSCVYARIY